jgi:hypothetical protein
VAEGFVPGGGLADDVDSFLLEQVAQSGPEEVMVVDEQNAWDCLLRRCHRLDRFGHLIPFLSRGLTGTASV